MNIGTYPRSNRVSFAANGCTVGPAERGPVMSDKGRMILALALGELLLAGVWFYVASTGGQRSPGAGADFERTVGLTMGAAMAAFLGLGILLIVIATRKKPGG
jgi:hypothetical protein